MDPPYLKYFLCCKFSLLLLHEMQVNEGFSYWMKVRKPKNWRFTNSFLKLIFEWPVDIFQIFFFCLLTKACTVWLLLVLWVLLRKLWQKLPSKLKIYLFFHFLTSIMYFQNVSMVTIATTELIPHKF